MVGSEVCLVLCRTWYVNAAVKTRTSMARAVANPAEQPEERSDEAAIAAKQVDLRTPKMTAEPFGDCKSPQRVG